MELLILILNNKFLSIQLIVLQQHNFIQEEMTLIY